MYLYLKDIEQIHYINQNMYVIKSNGKTKILNQDDALLVKLIHDNFHNIKDIMEVIKKDNNDIINLDYKLNQRIINLSDILERTWSKRDEGKCNVNITGEKGKSYPLKVQIALTNRCFHHCKHCFLNACQIGNDINYDTVNNFLSYIQSKTDELELTGGEPFLYNNFSDIVEKFSSKFNVTTTTSGYWKKEFSKEFLQQFSLIQLTLYGNSEEHHNKFVGVEDSFQQVMNNIHKIMNSGVNLIVQTQARSNDVVEVRKFVEMCIREGIPKIMIGSISPIGRAKSLKIWDNYNPSVIQNNINSIRKEYEYKIDIIFDDERHIDTCNSSKFFSCNAGRIKWYITENGNILPCALVDRDIFSIGNIYNDSFKDLIEKNSFDDIQTIWFDKKEEIHQKYSEKGIKLRDICTKI